ncbi:MAG: ABC transporter substrate-binding protein [Propionibacteriaceae bacterium]|jgi:polar amino acid transport system substrate-binding protein|nr:ABC transporter substrate-binding protein [Propionibacteriaceae bacterium]
MKRLLKAGTAVAALALVLAGCGSTGSDNTGSGDDNAQAADYTVVAGKLTVCADVPYPPFEDFDDSTASGFTGFDVDLVQAIADRLDLELVMMDSDFDALQSGLVLTSDQCDMGASAITITEARKANIDFAEPYYDSLQSLLVKTSSGIASLDDLAGKTIGVQSGTTGKHFAEENAPASATLLDLPSDGDLWPALQAGQIDAILQDYPVNLAHVQADSNYAVVQQWTTDEQYGFAFPKGRRTELRQDVSQALQAMRDDGTYDTIYNRYFG